MLRDQAGSIAPFSSLAAEESPLMERAAFLVRSVLLPALGPRRGMALLLWIGTVYVSIAPAWRIEARYGT